MTWSARDDRIQFLPLIAGALFPLPTVTASWAQSPLGAELRTFHTRYHEDPGRLDEIRHILDLDPKFTPVYALAGYVFYEVPGLLGGDLDKAEEMFRKGLEQDPMFTGIRVGLGKALIKKGRIAEGRRELQAVLDEKEPSNLADWTLKDSKEARELLESVKGRF